MAQYIELYRMLRYWRHIVSCAYRDNYRSDKFGIPLYSSKLRCQQQTMLIAIGIINKESDWRGIVSYRNILCNVVSYRFLLQPYRANTIKC